MELAGTRPTVAEDLPPNGADPTAPVEAASSEAPPAAAEPAKSKRARITPEKIEEIRTLKASGLSFKAVSEKTGVSIGSIQKYVADPATPKAPKKAKAAKPAAKAAPAAPKAKRGRPRKVASTAPEGGMVASAQIPSLTVKAALFDLMQQGITAAQIRNALAGF